MFAIFLPERFKGDFVTGIKEATKCQTIVTMWSWGLYGVLSLFIFSRI